MNGLNGATNGSPMRYGLTWNGKSRARRAAHTPARSTLVPCPEKSVNWDTTRNLLIEGDNLEALKLLQESYRRKVRMIYIDPPYNTGKDFIYPDDFRYSVADYLRLTCQADRADQSGRRPMMNVETSGRYHTDWLNMMYPRLKLGRSLLRDDGVIFISIGDQELANLRLICNELFGEGNCLGCVARVAKRTSNKGTHFAPSKDYVLVYARRAECVAPFMDVVRPSYAARFAQEDERGHYATVGLYQAALDPRPNQRYWIECPDGSFVIPPGEVFPEEVADAAQVRPASRRDRVWRWSRQSYLEKRHLLVFKESARSPLLTPDGSLSKWNVYTKYYLEDRLKDGTRPRDYLDDVTNDLGTAALKRLGLDDFFEFAKPPELMRRLMHWLGGNEGVYMDFFAGSGTLAQAVLEQNAEDGGNRQFILVQLPEPCPEDSVAAQSGYPTIADICRERVRRVMAGLGDQDGGFKVFKLDATDCAMEGD
ncbi:MAG TPA: site-specific DNA-methyltransferase [Firmicutes bacterium]|nr:site-specific DNA-methyltransferase [Bacillota bacterium]